MSALYKNGEMKPDADGNVTVAEAKQSFERAGIPAPFLANIFPGDKFLGGDETVNIFKMDNSKFEHATSTGVRDLVARLVLPTFIARDFIARLVLPSFMPVLCFHPCDFVARLVHANSSTGVRDPLPDPKKWEEFAGFAGADGSFGVEELKTACQHFDQTANSSDVHEGNHGSAMAVFPLFLQVFTGFVENARMSVATLRALVMESVFPEGFGMKPRTE